MKAQQASCYRQRLGCLTRVSCLCRLKRNEDGTERAVTDSDSCDNVSYITLIMRHHHQIVILCHQSVYGIPRVGGRFESTRERLEGTLQSDKSPGCTITAVERRGALKEICVL